MNDIAEQKSFQDRMKDRIKDSIGELMTDKELAEIVHRAMEEIFFKPMKLETGYRTEERPPFVHQLLKDIMANNVKEAVADYIKRNNALVMEEIKKLVEQGMGKALVSAISSMFQNDMYNFQQNLITTVQNNR